MLAHLKMSNGFPEKILEYKKNGDITQWRTLDPRQVLRLELSHCLLGEMIATIFISVMLVMLKKSPVMETSRVHEAPLAISTPTWIRLSLSLSLVFEALLAISTST